jgi:hypothetical protein
MIGYGETFGTGDVVGCHMDLARGVMYFRKNGRRIGESEPESLSIPIGRLVRITICVDFGYNSFFVGGD